MIYVALGIFIVYCLYLHFKILHLENEFNDIIIDMKPQIDDGK